MPRTALVHFKEDVARARAIVAHADPLPLTTDAELLLRGDLFRSDWMFAVGALDAYFCDAYTDVVAATIISKSRHPAMTLPHSSTGSSSRYERSSNRTRGTRTGGGGWPLGR